MWQVFQGKTSTFAFEAPCTNHTYTENVVLWNLNTMRCPVLLQEISPEHNCSDLEYLLVLVTQGTECIFLRQCYPRVCIYA